MFEVSALFLVYQNQVYGVFDLQAIVNVFVGRSELNSIHIHANGNELALVGAAIHHFVFDQIFCFSFGGGARPKNLFPHQVDLHELYF